MTPLVLTQEEYELKKLCLSLDRLIKIEGESVKINQEVDKEREDEDQESLYQKLRSIKKSYFILQVYLEWFASAFEKIHNLYTWKEYRRTMYVLAAMIFVFFIIRVLPIRYIMLVGGI